MYRQGGVVVVREGERERESRWNREVASQQQLTVCTTSWPRRAVIAVATVYQSNAYRIDFNIYATKVQAAMRREEPPGENHGWITGRL